MKTIYCLSGLGADERIFKHLKVKNVLFRHLAWVPFDKADTMGSYAIKMFSQINDSNPIILGLSFGGMLSTEIATQLPVRKTIIISSAKGKQELPDLSSFLIFILKSGLVPFSLFKQPNKILFDRFGAEEEDEKQILSDILKDTTSDHLREAFKIILNWDNKLTPENIIHIHGTHDKIISPGLVSPNYWIPGGTHMMIWNRANEIAAIIEKELENI